MREMLAVTAGIIGIPELSETVALLSDGRVSAATLGIMDGHVDPGAGGSGVDQVSGGRSAAGSSAG